MWQDPIIKETRKLREEYAAKFNHDPDAIFDDILARQEKTERKVVSFPARKPRQKSKCSIKQQTGNVECSTFIKNA